MWNGGLGSLHSVKRLILHRALHFMLYEPKHLYNIALHCFSTLTKSCILDCTDIAKAVRYSYKRCSLDIRIDETQAYVIEFYESTCYIQSKDKYSTRSLQSSVVQHTLCFPN